MAENRDRRAEAAPAPGTVVEYTGGSTGASLARLRGEGCGSGS
jgi:hypothetical protein